MDLGSSLTIKARTVTIFSGHSIPFQARHKRRHNIIQGFFLEVFRPPRGRQSRNESEKNTEIRIMLVSRQSNAIDAQFKAGFVIDNPQYGSILKIAVFKPQISVWKLLSSPVAD